jgi:hypothetical protein
VLESSVAQDVSNELHTYFGFTLKDFDLAKSPPTSSTLTLTITANERSQTLLAGLLEAHNENNFDQLLTPSTSTCRERRQENMAYSQHFKRSS